MKIVIVGAGISGLSFYLFLEKFGLTRDNDVTIYDTRDVTGQSLESGVTTDAYNASVIGASLGLSTAGLHVLRRLDQELYDDVLRAGQTLRRCKISNARGWTLADVPVGAEGEFMLMIGREAFWQCFRKRIPDAAVRKGKAVRIHLSHGDIPDKIVFDDGEEEVADVIVGADGIWSAVRRAMFDGPDQASTYEYSPQYEGLVGVGGFVPSDKLVQVPTGEMNIVFGSNGFFGYAHTGSVSSSVISDGQSAVWWSTYTLKSCPNDWRHIGREDVDSQLQRRHRGWHNSTVQNILKDVNVGSLYPTFITPLLPLWHRSSCVLIGDAAHALHPSSGQGASMALEDSETLALLLQLLVNKDPGSGHRTAIEMYSHIRMPRLAMVHRKAQELGSMKQDMGFVQEMVMYLIIWLVNAFGLNASYNRKLNCYDVPEQVKSHLQEHA